MQFDWYGSELQCFLRRFFSLLTAFPKHVLFRGPVPEAYVPIDQPSEFSEFCPLRNQGTDELGI